MTLKTDFVELPLEDLHREAAVMKADGWRFIQTLAVNTDDGVDLYYSFMKDGLARNYKVKGVQKGTPVPSITDIFLAAFVFENEARELFGVNMRDIAIDFDGAMYAPAEAEPMTFLSPEQKAARDKARKAAAAKAAKAAGGARAAEAPKAGGFVMTEEKRQKLEAKLATMSPDKVEKVRAALAAREAEAANAGAAKDEAPKEQQEKDAPAEKTEPKDAEKPAKAPVDALLEEKIAAMDPDKAAKVRAVLGGAEPQLEEQPPAPVETAGDALLAEKIAAMDPDKAAKVRTALAAHPASAATEGGE